MLANSRTRTTGRAPPGDATATATATEEQEAENEIAQAPIPPVSKLLSLARPELPMILFAFFLMVGSEVVSLYNPLLLADAYDYLVDPTYTSSSERMSKINPVVAIVLVLHTASVLAGFLRGSLLKNMVGERVVARLRNRLYGSILDQEIAFFDQHKTGELVSRLGSDTTLLQQATSLALPEVLVGVIKLVVSMALMFWISVKLAGLTLGFVFVIFMVCLPFGKWIGTLSKSYQNILGTAQTRSTEALSSMRTVQSFAAEEREKERYRQKIGEPADFRCWWPSNYKTHKTTYSVGFFKSIVGSTFYSVLFGVGFGSMYVSLWYGFKLVSQGSISLGDLTAFQSYIFQIGAGLGQTSRFLTQLMEAQGASGRIFALLERQSAIPKVPPPPVSRKNKDKTDNNHDEENPSCPNFDSQQRPSSMEGMVQLHNVSFAYPSRPNVKVLCDVSLIIPPNTTAALVGGSGQGKSTIVALLQRFYDVNEGSITVDGIDIRQLDLTWLRTHIGYVQQEPSLFGMSVRENVTYGIKKGMEISQKHLEQVCRMANAHDFIMSWPNGYDTLVGERGVKLSGGQKQRLAIARALLVDPRILIFDEATSALDAESEHLVQEAIEKAVVGRTVLIVAHRLSTIKQAQQIVVIDDHRIVDIGSHDILLQRCVKYKDLIKRQSVMMNPDSAAAAAGVAGK